MKEANLEPVESPAVGKLCLLISNWIRQDVQAMKPHAGSPVVSLSGLKRLQRKLENSANLPSDKESQFFVFFLSSFLQDVFFNLTGDVPYSEAAQEKKQELYGKLLDTLTELAETLNSQDAERKIFVCGKLVNTYLSGVRSLNAALTQEQL